MQSQHRGRTVAPNSTADWSFSPAPDANGHIAKPQPREHHWKLTEVELINDGQWVRSTSGHFRLPHRACRGHHASDGPASGSQRFKCQPMPGKLPNSQKCSCFQKLTSIGTRWPGSAASTFVNFCQPPVVLRTFCDGSLAALGCVRACTAVLVPQTIVRSAECTMSTVPYLKSPAIYSE